MIKLVFYFSMQKRLYFETSQNVTLKRNTVPATKNAILMFSKELKLIFIPADNFYFFNSQVNVFVYILKHINNTKKTPPPSMTPGSLPSSLSTSSFLPATSITNCSRFGIESLSFLSMSRGVPRCPQDPESLYLLHQDWDAGNLLLLELVLEPIPEVFDRIKVRRISRPSWPWRQLRTGSGTGYRQWRTLETWWTQNWRRLAEQTPRWAKMSVCSGLEICRQTQLRQNGHFEKWPGKVKCLVWWDQLFVWWIVWYQNIRYEYQVEAEI